MFFGKKVTGPAEWLLVCLGNYGKQYENTRHNIGFMAAERLIDKQGLRCNRLRFRALTDRIRRGARAADDAADLYEPLRRGGGRGGAVL